ncbi:MAG: glycogen debranching protein [Anaerolineales bacterium]|nr:glycogen debranching protein [Anaerolineales bacterium]
MLSHYPSAYLSLLKNRIDLHHVPFSDRGSRLMVFRNNSHFSVRLAERWFKREGQLAAYRDRPPLIDAWQFTNAEGQPLSVKVTTYPHRVDVETDAGDFCLAFVDSETLLVTLPPQACGLAFRANLDRCQTDRRGGLLRLTGDIRRNIAYTTNAPLLVNDTQALGADSQAVRLGFGAHDGRRALLLNITPRLGFNRWVPDPRAALDAAARRWHAWFEAAPPVSPALQAQYYYAWWIMRAGLISTRFYTTREAMTPSKLFYVGVWQWDAYFHALAYRHMDMHLAKDQIRIVLDHQREDGMIPDAIHDEGTVTRLTYPIEADVTKPPLLAWAAWKLYEADGDREFIDEIYEPVVRSNNWWFAQNDTDNNGLCEYQHPFSSGLDDSPLWDEGMPVESPDLNTYLCLQQEALGRMAQVIGAAAEAELWAGRAQTMADRMLREMWDPQAGLFWASRPPSRARVNVRTPFNLFPLITGRMPPEVSRRLVAHLTDERSFWPRYPVPTVALDDAKYESLTMWRGPTWVNVNYLLIEGLQRAGYAELARELRRRTLEMILGDKDIYEYYQPETGDGPPKAASTFGWSSALFIEMAVAETKEKEHELST